MSDNLLTFERDRWTGGVKALPVGAGFGLTTGGALTTTDEAFQTVPWLYRAATLRAATLSRMPYCVEDVATGEELEDTDPRIVNIMRWMTRTLYLAELSRVLYGAAYFLLESNKFGLNTTPRYIPRAYVTPIVDYVDGVTGFTVSFMGTGNTNVPLNKMVYVWEPNPASEVAPGPAPAYVALQAAGMLGALDRMATQYFAAGAVPITAVKVPPSVGTDEREKIQNWFARAWSGFRNAFKFMPVSLGTEFEQIGANVKDTAAPELTQTQRDNVAVALGVPPTVLDGKAANYATANSEMMGFYLHTVIPSGELIAEALNVQLFERAGLRFAFEPDDLEIMQSAQLEQAQAVQDLTGGKAVLSVNEARGILDYDPIPNGDWPAEPQTATPPPQFGASSAAGSMPMDAADMGASGGSAANMEDMAKAWLTASLDAFKGGSSPAVGTPWDAELSGASSANMVKRIYAAHWPQKEQAPAESWQAQAVKELARYNALAEGVTHNG